MAKHVRFLSSLVLTVLGSAGAVEAVQPAASAQVTVDCSKATIQAELSRKDDPLTIVFFGTCTEQIVISRDRVLLQGTGTNPEIVGSVDITGASGVTLRSFAVRNSANRGVRVRFGSAARLEQMTVENNASIGVHVSDSSSAVIQDSTFSNNGFAGVGATEASSISLLGTVRANDNPLTGLFVGGGSTVRAFGTVEANDNLAGIWLQDAGNGNFSGPVTANDNGEVGIRLHAAVAEFSAAVSLADNGSYGIVIFANSTLGVGDLIVANSDVGILVEGDSFGGFAQFGGAISVTGSGTFGILVEGSRANLFNTTTSDPVSFEFGARIQTNGGSSLPNLTCDATVLTRGPISCPP